MAQRVLRIGTAAVLILAKSTSAWACYNDSGSEAAEREFRSRYDRPAPASRAGEINPWAVGTACVGSLLNVAAIGLLLRSRRAKGDAVEAGAAQGAGIRP